MVHRVSSRSARNTQGDSVSKQRQGDRNKFLQKERSQSFNFIFKNVPSFSSVYCLFK